MGKRVECYYEKDNSLKMIINIKLGFLDTMSFLFFSILTLPVGLCLTSLMLFGTLSLRLFQLPIKTILILVLVTILMDYLGIMSVYQWLRYNFGKEIIVLNNKEKSLKYQQLVIGFGKTRVFEYCNITKIVQQVERKRYPDYYCCLIHQGKKFRFGIVRDINEAKNIVRRINDFLIQ